MGTDTIPLLMPLTRKEEQARSRREKEILIQPITYADPELIFGQLNTPKTKQKWDTIHSEYLASRNQNVRPSA